MEEYERNYTAVGFAEFIATIVLVTVVLWLTYIGLSNGLMEANPVSAWELDQIGFIGNEVLRVAILIIIYIGMYWIGERVDARWLPALVFALLILLFFMDAYNDFTVLTNSRVLP